MPYDISSGVQIGGPMQRPVDPVADEARRKLLQSIRLKVPGADAMDEWQEIKVQGASQLTPEEEAAIRQSYAGRAGATRGPKPIKYSMNGGPEQTFTNDRAATPYTINYADLTKGGDMSPMGMYAQRQKQQMAQEAEDKAWGREQERMKFAALAPILAQEEAAKISPTFAAERDRKARMAEAKFASDLQAQQAMAKLQELQARGLEAKVGREVQDIEDPTIATQSAQIQRLNAIVNDPSATPQARYEAMQRLKAGGNINAFKRAGVDYNAVNLDDDTQEAGKTAIADTQAKRVFESDPAAKDLARWAAGLKASWFSFDETDARDAANELDARINSIKASPEIRARVKQMIVDKMPEFIRSAWGR
jgi:hypothetical protein